MGFLLQLSRYEGHSNRVSNMPKFYQNLGRRKSWYVSLETELEFTEAQWFLAHLFIINNVRILEVTFMHSPGNIYFMVRAAISSQITCSVVLLEG